MCACVECWTVLGWLGLEVKSHLRALAAGPVRCKEACRVCRQFGGPHWRDSASKSSFNTTTTHPLARTAPPPAAPHRRPGPACLPHCYGERLSLLSLPPTLTTRITLCALKESSPLVGSSRKRQSGEESRLMAMLARLACLGDEGVGGGGSCVVEKGRQSARNLSKVCTQEWRADIKETQP